MSTLSLSEQLLTTLARPPVLILRPTLVSLLLLGLFFSSSVSSRPLLLRLSAASGLRQLLRQLLLILDSENIALPSNTHLNMKLKGKSCLIHERPTICSLLINKAGLYYNLPFAKLANMRLCSGKKQFATLYRNPSYPQLM